MKRGGKKKKSTIALGVMYADFFFRSRIHPSTVIGVTVETNAVMYVYLDYFIVIPFFSCSRNRKNRSSRKRNGRIRGGDSYISRIKFIGDPLGTLESGDSVDFR